MFNSEEISRIDRMLREGITPEKVGEDFGMALSTLRQRLANSGYKIAVKRELEKIEAVEPLALAAH